MAEILVVGDLMIDVVVSMESGLNENSDTPCTISQTIGGTAINVATWARNIDAQPYIIGCIGTDIAGAEIKAHLEQWKIVNELTSRADYPTGMVVALAHLNGERSMFPDSRANSSLQLSQFANIDWARFSHFYISGYTLINRNTLDLALHLMELARQNGVKVVLDPASAAPILRLGEQEIRSWISRADILIPNEFEFSAITQLLECEAAEILEMCEALVIKYGSGGARLVTNTGEKSFAAPRVEVVDSVGAGDAFAGTLIGLLSQGMEIDSAIPHAIENSTNSVTNRGAQPIRN